jgi:hypothetical protein
VRKLPVIGIRDWLLIYEDTLVELSVKDAYDELEIVVVPRFDIQISERITPIVVVLCAMKNKNLHISFANHNI